MLFDWDGIVPGIGNSVLIYIAPNMQRFGKVYAPNLKQIA